MKKSAVKTMGILTGIVVAGAVGMVIGGKSETRRFMKKTARMLEDMGEKIHDKMQC